MAIRTFYTQIEILFVHKHRAKISKSVLDVTKFQFTTGPEFRPFPSGPATFHAAGHSAYANDSLNCCTRCNIHLPSCSAALDADLNENSQDDSEDKHASNTSRYCYDYCPVSLTVFCTKVIWLYTCHNCIHFEKVDVIKQ